MDIFNTENCIEVKIKQRNLINGFDIPRYATAGSSGLDLRAYIMAPVHIHAGEIKIIDTGISIQLPSSKYEAQIRSRSGLAAKSGIAVLNSPGTIDSDYTGEIKVILINLSNRCFTVNPADRIAQIVFQEVSKVKFINVDVFQETDRSENGFGSTGIN